MGGGVRLAVGAPLADPATERRRAGAERRPHVPLVVPLMERSSAQLATAKMRFHVDVNVGDPIWPRPAPVQFPRLLGGNIRLLGYPIPMVLAEKIVTASQRGITSTRWRDFADIYLLTGQHRLIAGDIHAAINKVSTYRNAEMGPLRPVLDGYPAIASQVARLAHTAKP